MNARMERIRAATPALAALASDRRSPVDKLLERLDGVKPTGPGRWIAKCPAHDDHHPSLSIAEKDDAVLLVHCWAGCTVGDVLAAVGLELKDLFPDNYRKSGSGPLPTWRRDRLQAALDHELTILEIAGVDLRSGRTLSPEDAKRVRLASDRVDVLRGRINREH